MAILTCSMVKLVSSHFKFDWNYFKCYKHERVLRKNPERSIASFVYVSLLWIFSEIALDNSPKKMAHILFSVECFPSYWHMPVEIGNRSLLATIETIHNMGSLLGNLNKHMNDFSELVGLRSYSEKYIYYLVFFTSVGHQNYCYYLFNII